MQDWIIYGDLHTVLDTRDNDTETGPWSLQLNSFEIIRMKGEGGKHI